MSIEAEQRLFEQCLAAGTGAECERILAQHPQRVVADRVRRLLAAHHSNPTPLVARALPSAGLPAQVGPYRILEKIGEGAIGEVFLAEQEHPVRRRVGLKILKFGIGTREVMARFELERQTLALMTHPHIARILDAGTVADGRPYFAMEYVPGTAITRYCDEHRLGLDERLAIFSAVCAGVQHAHLRGVIHRDLKPSNILIAEVDSKPTPKIIDFGIAKATTEVSDLSDVRTRIGNVLGTPEYMSPEQAQLSPLDIDVRTDVYSLGVLLYELLTGERPYRVTHDSFDPAVIARDILHGEVIRPSLRVAAESPEADSRARDRKLERRALAARLRGDLDWITMKALEKDRQRRYASVADLAADLERIGTHEPVMAGPPSTSYRVGKFVRRHRIGVVALASLFLAALVFGSGMAVLARRAAAERDRANEEAEVARRVTDFTASLFEDANPAKSGASDISARQILDAGVRRLETREAQERADVRAALFEAAANAYRGLGDYAKAAPLIEKALTIRAASSTEAPGAYGQVLQSKAALLRVRGDFEAAEAGLRAAIDAYGNSRPPNSVAQRRARLDLASILRLRSHLDEAAEIAAQLVAEYSAVKPPDPAGRALAMTAMGRIETERGHLTEAVRYLEQGLELHRQAFGSAAVQTLDAKDGLAWALVTKDESARAEPLLREIVEDTRRIYGPVHIEVGIALSSLGNAVSDLPGRLPDAEQIYLESVVVLRRSAGPWHPELATSLNNLCSLYVKWRHWKAARDACAEATSIRVKALGATHPDTAGAQLGEALALNKLGEFAGAETLLRGVVATFSSQLGAGHWRTGNAQTYLGLVLINLKRYDEAEAILVQSEQTLLQALGPDHYRTKAAHDALTGLKARGQPTL